MWVAILLAALALLLALAAVVFVVVGRHADSNGGLTERVRSMAGLLAVVASDGAIAGAAAVGIDRASADSNQVVALLTSAFTAITAITTAYFGIKAVSNTAASALHKCEQETPRKPT
ncbi:hypothetical protein OG937_45805 [Streptomyces sp. NBC_00510]